MAFPHSAALFLFVAASACTPALAADHNHELLAEAFALFSKGAYSQAITLARQINPGDSATRAERAFFLGTTEAKLQSFNEAADDFATALAAGSKETSLHYDYGQALFATQKLAEAETQFKRSIIGKFKMGAAAYYIAYIRSVLADKPGARDFYNRIGKLSADPDKVKQSALFQIAELAREDADALKLNARWKDRRRELLEGEVEGLYRRARDFDSATPIAEQCRARIAEIETELEGMIERMRNGNPLPRHLYSLLVTQDFSYNSNVIAQADEALVQVSNADAVEWKTGFLAKYQFPVEHTFSFIPELGGTVSYYSRRSTPSVYQNDNVSLSPALHTKYEHWSGGKAATLQADFSFNLLLRDYKSRHQLPFYTRTYESDLSERVKWFATGSSTLKVGVKLVEYYDPAKNDYVPLVSYTQLFNVWGTSFVNTFTFDYLHARDNSNDERNYRYRGSITFSHVVEKIDATPSFSLFLKDTMLQKGTRGNELNLAPDLTLNRALAKHVDGTLEYTWTKNNSKSKDVYQYTQGLLHFGVSYTF